MTQHLKLLLRKSLDAEPINWILAIMVCVVALMFMSCGATEAIDHARVGLKAGAEVATVTSNTVKEIDTDGSGSISFPELVTWLFVGWAGGRSAETAAKVAVKKVKKRKAKKA